MGTSLRNTHMSLERVLRKRGKRKQVVGWRPSINLTRIFFESPLRSPNSITYWRFSTINFVIDKCSRKTRSTNIYFNLAQLSRPTTQPNVVIRVLATRVNMSWMCVCLIDKLDHLQSSLLFVARWEKCEQHTLFNQHHHHTPRPNFQSISYNSQN